MSKALALLALTVLSSVYAAEVPQPSWTNHNRIAGSQQMMTNFKPWAEAVESTLGDKLDTTNGTANCLGVENGLTVSGDATFSGGYLAVGGDLFVDSNLQVVGRTEFLGNDNYFYGNARFGGESNRFYTVPYMQSNSEETKHFFATLDDINALDELKRDNTDNMCHKTEFTEWTFSSSPENDELISQLDPSKLIRDDSVQSTWIWRYSGEPADYAVFVGMISGSENDTEVTGFTFERKDVSGVQYEVTATRSAICVSNDIFVTWTSTTNGVNEAIASATNDSSIVRAPLNEYGQRVFSEPLFVPPGTDDFNINATTHFYDPVSIYNISFLRDSNGNDVLNTLANKADRATTLSGYGITDGATKTEVVPLWVAGHVYNAGDTVLYNGAYYRAMFDETSSPPDKTFSYWEPITFENVYVYDGLSVLSGNLLVANGELELVGGGITVDSGFEIKHGINKVVYGISVNGGEAQHGDVSIDIPAPGNYAAVSNAAMSAVQPWQISHTNAMFSAEVLAVQIDTNTVAQIGELKAFFDDLPTGAVGTSLGGIILALLGAAAWLKKNKVGSFASVGGASATVENGVAKLSDFFTESNSLLNGRLVYERNATGLKDRAFNALTFDGTEYNLSTALAEVTPTASGQPRDLLIVATATAATTISFTAGTIKGDKPTIDGAGTWLITLTEFESGVWYCRQIKMEDAA